MNPHSSRGRRRRGLGRGLALAGLAVVALAASPAALASDRGGPGASSVQSSITYPDFGVVLKAPGRFVSWSD